MKTVTNTPLVKRNRRIGQVASIAGILVLVVGAYLSFTDTAMSYLSFSLIALVAGFFLSQIGIAYSNRWGRSPRPDEVLTLALKGLSDRFLLLNYITPAPHLLVSTAGFWILLPYEAGKQITYDAKRARWLEKGGNTMSRWFLGRQGIGRPDLDLEDQTRALRKYLLRFVSNEDALPNIQAAMVITSPKTVIDAADSPVPVLHVDKLKDFMRGKAKQNVLSEGELANWSALLAPA